MRASRPGRPGAPRISVVIPAWNRADTLRDALDSVLAQTHAVDEVVVVDDGSTDDTAAVAAAYAARGVRCLQQENQGVSAARNRGLRETSGNWVAFLDADDLWEPHKIEWQLQATARDPHIVLVSGYAWFWNVDADTRRLMTFGAGHANPRHEIAVRNTVGNTSLVLARRDVLQELEGFDTTLRYGEDWEMWIRVLRLGRAVIVPRPLLVYRWHAESNSRFRDWGRYDVLSDISKKAIRETEPVWLHPVLHLRRLAYLHSGRAAFAVAREKPRAVQIRHALTALLLYPFDDTRARCGAAVRAFLGSRAYGWLRRGSRAADSDPPGG